MTARRRLAESGLALALAVWIAVVVASGLAAAFMFPGMKALAPILPEFSAAPADWHWRLAAGKVMERIFFSADLVRMLAAPLAVALAVGLAWRRSRSRAATARAVLVALAAATFAVHAIGFAARMNGHLRAHWAAAAAGDLAEAEAQRDAFNALHPTADALHSASLVLLLPALALAPWCARTETPR